MLPKPAKQRMDIKTSVKTPTVGTLVKIKSIFGRSWVKISEFGSQTLKSVVEIGSTRPEPKQYGSGRY
ncbi:hypothetical protein N9A45_02150 [bacterium]|nr:hypothetical protein [bacterium]